jgi:hypothetical protein
VGVRGFWGDGVGEPRQGNLPRFLCSDSVRHTVLRYSIQSRENVIPYPYAVTGGSADADNPLALDASAGPPPATNSANLSILEDVMPNFWKATIQASGFGQEFINVLYYVDDATGTATFDTARMGELANELDDLWEAGPCLNLPTGYVGEQVSVVLVDDQNETISPFAVEATASFAGNGTVSLATAAACAVIGFRVGPMAEGQTDPTPKRSYIAVGPLAESIVADNGLIGLTTMQQEAFMGDLAAVIVGSLGDYRPCRVGRGRADLQPSYGEVVDTIFRPYASFRRSRLIRPSGA